ncbi:MAG: transposase, partial [Clostridia bacterium]|nr:transposase [Clostridia bacterium]
NVNFDKYVIMPNHIHIILCIKNGGRGDPSPTVSNIVGWLKYNVTREINEICGVIGTPIFQRSFHDHIIRGEKDYIEICKYIENNPAKWLEDKFYTE